MYCTGILGSCYEDIDSKVQSPTNITIAPRVAAHSVFPAVANGGAGTETYWLGILLHLHDLNSDQKVAAIKQYYIAYYEL